MADNYLEKRMDDYAHGRLGTKTTSSARRSGYASIKYPHQQVLILNCDASPAGEAVLRILVEAGCTVCFTAFDRKEGNRMAQGCGGRFYPLALSAVAADMERRGEKLDTIIVVNPESIKEAIDGAAFISPRQWLVISDNDAVKVPEDVACAVLSGHSPEAAAVLALALVHPAVNVRGLIKP